MKVLVKQSACLYLITESYLLLVWLSKPASELRLSAVCTVYQFQSGHSAANKIINLYVKLEMETKIEFRVLS